MRPNEINALYNEVLLKLRLNYAYHENHKVNKPREQNGVN